jgi:micrococcal nuclease
MRRDGEAVMWKQLLASILVGALIGQLLLPFPTRAQTGQLMPVMVASVIDGDTVQIVLPDGTTELLRMIGVDAPEILAPGVPPQCFSAEATARLSELLTGRTPLLESDAESRDSFGRLLGYLWLQDDGAQPWMVNERLAAEGLAFQLTIPPNVRYVDRFAAAVQSARDQGLGLWSACGPSPNATSQTVLPRSGSSAPVSSTGSMPVPPAPGQPVPPITEQQVCDAAYPTVCIPPPPPDLDCNQVRFRGFTVLPPDPHGFDPDNDGNGC